MPRDYTKDGRDRSPALQWSALPEGTRSLALICEDPDAPGEEPWSHWVLYDIPPFLQGHVLTGLPEGISKTERPREIPEAIQGRNDFGVLGYGGPSPPPGHGVHHYRFILYALDDWTNLPAGAARKELLEAMGGHVLGETRCTGTYQRGAS